eukprot:GHVH01008986.1.p1 GENE.GHVH01008986.1~~GHVH01008986.1.p1  ORF type:complete len:395 (+),score=70.52 GHVH01008986.1:779-1963(+)
MSPSSQDHVIITPESCPPMDQVSPHSPDSRQRMQRPRRGKNIALTMPVVRGNVLYSMLSLTMCYPMDLSNQRDIANKINDNKARRICPEGPPFGHPELVKQSVFSVWKTQGLSTLYRGFPLTLTHNIMNLLVRQVARDVLVQIMKFLKDPSSTRRLTLTNPFPLPKVCSKDHIGLQTDEVSSDRESESNDDQSIVRQADTMLMRYLNDHEESSEEDDDFLCESVLMNEAIELSVDVIAEIICYPLMTIAQRQSIVQEDVGYSWLSMVNVSYFLDGGYGWLYRGISWRLSNLVLRSAGRLSLDFAWDQVNSIIDNPPMREISRQMLFVFTRPLEVMANVERNRSQVPGLIDDEIELRDVIDVVLSKRFQLMAVMLAGSIPLAIGGKYLWKFKSEN